MRKLQQKKSRLNCNPTAPRLLSTNARAVKAVLENYLLELGMLEDAYITSRYVMREFTKHDAEKLTKAVKEIMENVT